MPPNSGKKKESATPTKGRASAPAKGTGERPQKSAAASGRTRRPKTSRKQTLKTYLLPMLSLWVLAFVVLVGLIYWGGYSPSVARRSTQPPGASTPERKDRAAGAAPRQAPTSAQSAARSSSKDSTREADHASPPRSEQTSGEEPHRDGPPNRQPPKPQSEHVDLTMANLSPRASVPVSPPPSRIPSRPTAPEVARVAIVIDDFGQDLEVARKFLELPLALTFSVLPHQKYSQEVAELAHSRGHEVILHLPMQPQGYPLKNPGKGALLTTMSTDAVRKSLQSALDVSPHFKGINNHMGSRFTEDSEAMGVFLNEVRQRGLYFLDSSTSPKSVGHSMAQELRVLTGRRDVFLDHTPTEEFVRSQIDELIRKAKVEGSAIAIGHPYEVTLRVLSQKGKRFEEEGVAVVPSGELVQRSVSEARLK